MTTPDLPTFLAQREEWRPIPGYEHTYRVSSLGRVESLPRNTTRGGLLAVRVGKRGYPVVNLVQDGAQRTVTVHSLVALAFLGPRPDGHEVRHLNGDTSDATAGNLAYGTHSENQLDKRAHGTDHNVVKTHCSKGHPFTTENTRRLASSPTVRRCKTCEQARAKATYAESQARTTPSPRRRQPWSPPETAEVLRTDITAEKIALLLGRSVSAVLSQRRRARQAAHPDFRPEWKL